MINTADICNKMVSLWARVDRGKISPTEARVHIGIARTILDAKKVEIAAAHLEQQGLQPLTIAARPTKVINGKKKG